MRLEEGCVRHLRNASYTERQPRGSPLSDLQSSLTVARVAVDEMIATAAACAVAWAVPAAPKKWSPAQVTEHVARSLEEAAVDLTGLRSKMPNLPWPLRFVARKLLFERVLARGVFPRAKTNKAMDPETGPESPSAASLRLVAAWRTFAEACRVRSADSSFAASRTFGAVPLADVVRFQEIHTRHHRAQMTRR